jgi:hypothetical protein
MRTDKGNRSTRKTPYPSITLPTTHLTLPNPLPNPSHRSGKCRLVYLYQQQMYMMIKEYIKSQIEYFQYSCTSSETHFSFC